MSEKTSPDLANPGRQLVVLGTGGTIAGTASSASDHTGYTAAQVSVAALLQAVPGLQDALQGHALVSEQVAQLDSKDMDFSTMRLLAQRCAYFLAQPHTSGIIITHGTDTLEETAYFLHCVIPPELQSKPVVLTCAMRPATSSQADGPRNLRDAVVLAREPRARGVLAVCAGDVHHAVLVQKVHTSALNAFSSGDVALGEPGRIGQVQGGQVHWSTQAEDIYQQNSPLAPVFTGLFAIKSIVNKSPATIIWPRVEIILNHSHATGSIVRALLASSTPQDPLRGLVVAGTGNGTVSESLEMALSGIATDAIKVVLASRCGFGPVQSNNLTCPATPSNLSYAKKRIHLMLELLNDETS
jgi:L-asparaginase